MMGQENLVLGEKLKEALVSNPFKDYIWKFPKNESSQMHKNMIDCSYEELQSFYDHCNKMLNNTEPLSLGRNTLLSKIDNQILKISTELLLRECINNNIDKYSLMSNIVESESDSDIVYSQDLINSIEKRFYNIPLELLKDACRDKLGYFNNSAFTKSFILKQSINLTRDDKKDLAQFAKENDIEDYNIKDIIRQYLGINDYYKITLNKRGLDLKDSHSMLDLKSTSYKYSDIYERDLQLLCYELLPKLKSDIEIHANRWQTLKNQIEEVCKYMKFELV